jgi:oligopeptide transport system substrate-binding protein
MLRRLSLQNFFFFLAAVLVLAALGYSLSFGTLPPANYTFVNGTEIKTVDPATATGVPEGRIIREIFEGLCGWHPADLHPIPGVAKSWDISADKKTYTFHLRKNARWTDGTPVTAEDFVYSWRRFLHPATAAEYSYEMWYIVNAERFTKQQVQVGDVVEIELPKSADNTDTDRPFAPGKIIKGKLLSIDPSDAPPNGDNAVEPGESEAGSGDLAYLVAVDGVPRRFHRGGLRAEDYVWLLPDFDTVGIKSLDVHTLEVKLKHPVPYFLDLTGFYPFAPVNRRCVESYSNTDWTKPENIVSNGPFQLEMRRVRDRIRLVKSPTYWDRDNVRLEIVDALAVESLTTGLNLYLTNQADWIEYVPNAVVKDLIAQKRPDFKPAPYITTYFYRLNVTRPPLNNPLVRRALNLATNKRDIVERVTMAGQQPARSMVPPVIEDRSHYKPALTDDFNPERARQLLAEAGYPDGKGFPTIAIDYNTNDTHKSIAELLQFQWKKHLGIQVELRALEWQAYLQNQQALQYDLSRSGWVGDYPDPNTFLGLWTSDSGNNKTGWANAQYDALIQKAQFEADEQKRNEFFREAERILMDELPVIPVYFYVSTSMVKPYVRGYFPNFHDLHPLRDVWIDEQAKQQWLSEFH